MRKFCLSLLIFSILLLGGTSARCEPIKKLETSRFPSLISSIRIDAPLYFCGEAVPLDNPEVRERLEKELLLTLWNRSQVILWLKRASRYFPHMEKVLKENHAPDDLKYVPVIESALRAHAVSPKRAVGFWQFLKSTGRRYDLKINANIDERRNVFASTRAAVKYFKDLYEILGSWTLSAAAYNMGEKGLEAEILTQKNNTYYHLYLPLETQRYVFKILSVKLILSNPEKYGFHLKKEDLYPPLQFDRVKLKSKRITPIQIVAEAAKTYFKMIKDLNPDIRGYNIGKGNYSILIPKGSAKGFHSRYQVLLNDWIAANEKRIYVVKRGDNLTAISERFDVPLPALAIWNRISLKKPIHPGQRLVIYPNDAGTKRKLKK
ncbi:transglycosylase SLT domain-containing protein [Thermodesulfobacteriota bacterium]